MLKMAQQSSNRHIQILKYKIHFLWLLEKQFLVHTPYNYGVFAAAKSSPLFAKSRAKSSLLTIFFSFMGQHICSDIRTQYACMIKPRKDYYRKFKLSRSVMKSRVISHHSKIIQPYKENKITNIYTYMYILRPARQGVHKIL